jgi:hypothetical protein
MPVCRQQFAGQFEERRPDLILLDYFMPKMNGLQRVGGSEECRGRLEGKVGAEGLLLLVAVGAGAEAAGDLDLVQVSGDILLRLAIDFAETIEAVAAAKRHGVQKRAEQIAHHRTDRGDVSEVSRSDRSLSSPSA